MNQIPDKFLKFIYYALSPYRKTILVYIFLALLSGCYEVISSHLIKLIVNNVSSPDNEQLTKLIIFQAIIFCLSFELLRNISSRAINYINLKICPIISSDLYKRIMSYLYNHSFEYFQNNLTGSITNNVNKIIDSVEQILTTYLSQLAWSLTQLILSIICMYLVHPIFSIILFSWTTIFFLISFGFSKKIILLGDGYSENKAIIAGNISDSITSSFNVRLFSKKRFEVNYLDSFLEDMIITYRKKDWFLIKLWWIQGSSITVMFGAMAIGLLELKTRNLVDAGDFAFILSLTLLVAQNIWYITGKIDVLNITIGDCNQALGKIIIPHEIIDKPGADILRVTNGVIAFNNVSFTYENKNNLFSNKSILIQPKQKVGLVGYSGSGKTSFVSLIIRLFEILSGSITIDDQNIADVTQESLRNNIGFIPQEPILFHRSLLDNIAYGKDDATIDEIIEAAKKAHAHEFISEMPEAYHTLVGERGIKLSGGQRQRIAIARAILKNAPILILDEATSSLDSITENYIQDSLKNLMRDKTVIVVAHRLSTLLNMDRILVFDKGNIVEDGIHSELLVKNGLYQKLWHSQIDGFIMDKKNE